MEKIIGTGTSGDFVLNNQVMAVEDGFKNVNKSWFDKTLTLEQGIEKIVDDRRTRHDVTCSISEVDFRVSNGKFVVEMLDGKEFIPTEKAIFDIARWCDQTSQSFVKRIREDVLKPNGKLAYSRDEKDAETLCIVLKNGKRRIEKDKKFLFRTYDDGSLRCMLSDKYAIIDNLWFMELMKEVLPDSRLSHWRGDEDNIIGNLLIPDSIREDFDSDYGGLLSLGNSEIGEGRFFQLPGLFRAICFNGTIWDRTNGKTLNKVHRGAIDLQLLRKDVIDNIHMQIPLAAELIDRLLNTRTFGFGNVNTNALYLTIGRALNLTDTEIVLSIDQFKDHESNEPNLFGLLNSVTRMSQKRDPKRWQEIDMAAGSLLTYNQNTWDKMIAKANLVSSEEIDELIAV